MKVLVVVMMVMILTYEVEGKGVLEGITINYQVMICCRWEGWERLER